MHCSATLRVSSEHREFRITVEHIALAFDNEHTFVQALGCQMAVPHDQWNPEAASIADGGNQLVDCVHRYCVDRLGMADNLNSPLSIIRDHVPRHFDENNKPPSSCVKLTLDIRQINENTKECERKWKVQLDAECITATTRAHFGYTVTEDGQKFTGHVWLPQNPPSFRDRDDTTGGTCYVKDRKKRGGPGNRGDTFFEYIGFAHNKNT